MCKCERTAPGERHDPDPSLSRCGSCQGPRPQLAHLRRRPLGQPRAGRSASQHSRRLPSPGHVWSVPYHPSPSRPSHDVLGAPLANVDPSQGRKSTAMYLQTRSSEGLSPLPHPKDLASHDTPTPLPGRRPTSKHGRHSLPDITSTLPDPQRLGPRDAPSPQGRGGERDHFPSTYVSTHLCPFEQPNTQNFHPRQRSIGVLSRFSKNCTFGPTEPLGSQLS